jgi:hypothetical protein
MCGRTIFKSARTGWFACVGVPLALAELWPGLAVAYAVSDTMKQVSHKSADNVCDTRHSLKNGKSRETLIEFSFAKHEHQ